MKGLKHVISFEYFNVVRRKAYLFSIAFYILLAIGINSIPAIIDFFSSDDQINAHTAIFYDPTGIKGEFNLDFHAPHLDWIPASSTQEMTSYVEAGDAAFGVHFEGGSSLSFVATNFDLIPRIQFMEIIAGGLFSYNIVSLVQADINATGIDPDLLVGPAGDVIGNIVIVLTFISVLSAGGSIMASIIKEKTSKIVEILFTSATPTAIMLGKVIAAALVGLTTGAILFATFFVVSRFSGLLGDIMAADGVLYGYAAINFVYMVLFFITAFISLSFIYAGLAATVSDNQESSTLAVIPMFVVMGAFYLGLGMLGNPEFISEGFVRAISFVPFVSPFAMIARINTVILPTWEILLILGLNVIYALLAAIISARIYTMCIMLFGTKINLRFLFKRLRKV